MNLHIRDHGRRRVRAFTLLEMMLVVVIIGLLVGVAVMNLTGQSRLARMTATKDTLRGYQQAVDSYFIKHGKYPDTLPALVPGEMNKLSHDAWREPVVYYLDPANPAQPYVLFSKGEDKQANTSDDISAWNIDE